MAKDLFTPLSLGGGKIVLDHRVVLAPLTRNRSTEPELAPKDIVVEYYSQRATKGGLLISEAINITPESLAYPSAPGIWSREQVRKWKAVTDAGREIYGAMTARFGFVCSEWQIVQFYYFHLSLTFVSFAVCVISSYDGITAEKSAQERRFHFLSNVAHGSLCGDGRQQFWTTSGSVGLHEG